MPKPVQTVGCLLTGLPKEYQVQKLRERALFYHYQSHPSDQPQFLILVIAQNGFCIPHRQVNHMLMIMTLCFWKKVLAQHGLNLKGQSILNKTQTTATQSRTIPCFGLVDFKGGHFSHRQRGGERCSCCDINGRDTIRMWLYLFESRTYNN